MLIDRQSSETLASIERRASNKLWNRLFHSENIIEEASRLVASEPLCRSVTRVSAFFLAEINTELFRRRILLVEHHPLLIGLRTEFQNLAHLLAALSDVEDEEEGEQIRAEVRNKAAAWLSWSTNVSV